LGFFLNFVYLLVVDNAGSAVQLGSERNKVK